MLLQKIECWCYYLYMNNQVINYPELTESPYKYIAELIKAGQNLVAYYKDGLIFENDNISLFVTLSHLERVIDHYRMLIPPGSSSAFPKEKSSLDGELDKFRNEIWEIRKDLVDREVLSGLDSAGESFKLRFREI